MNFQLMFLFNSGYDFGGKKKVNSLEIVPVLETGNQCVFLGCNSKTGLSTRKFKMFSRKKRELATFYTRKERCRKGKGAYWPHITFDL